MYYSVSVAVFIILALADAGPAPVIIDSDPNLQQRSGNPIISCGPNWTPVADLAEGKPGYASATNGFCNGNGQIRCSLSPGASCSNVRVKFEGTREIVTGFQKVWVVEGLPGSVNFTITNLGGVQLDVKVEDCIQGMMQVTQSTVRAQDGAEVVNVCWKADGNVTLGGTYEIPGVASYQARILKPKVVTPGTRAIRPTSRAGGGL